MKYAWIKRNENILNKYYPKKMLEKVKKFKLKCDFSFTKL